MSSTSPDAIIILGHGSRVPEASEAMKEVARSLKEKYGYTMVETCNMSQLGPHFKETFVKCVEAGASNIVLLPYFLHEGMHVKVDIPGMMKECLEDFPEVGLILGKTLGFDHSLTDLVHKRIEESASLCDVRELVLPDARKFAAGSEHNHAHTHAGACEHE